MSKIGFMTLLDREDSQLSMHFGKAKWIMIRDHAGSVTFEQNAGLNGRAVVETLRKHECSDVVFSEIGPGAFRHLQEAGIRGWIAPENGRVPDLINRMKRGDLPLAKEPTHASKSAPAQVVQIGAKSEESNSHGCCGSQSTKGTGQGCGGH